MGAVPQWEIGEQRVRLTGRIASGRLPISQKNLCVIPVTDTMDVDALIERRSAAADLAIIGFTQPQLRTGGLDRFRRPAGLRDVLFVSTHQRIEIE